MLNDSNPCKEAIASISARRASTTLLDSTDTYSRYVGKCKVIQSGPVFEVYEFQYPVILGVDTSKNRKGLKRRPQDRTEEYVRKRTTRARNLIRRLALSNFNTKDKFLTLTFADNVTDIEYANNEYRKFIKRLNRRYPNVKYISVIEFQKRGAIHYHSLINLPYVDQPLLEDLWGNGFIFIEKLTKVDNVGAYLSKYMGKDAIDKRLKGKKAYFTSRGLIRPQTEYYNSEQYYRLSERMNLDESKVAFANEYSSERNGLVKYTEYNTSHEFISKRRKS
jgi:hypothetical protein